VIPRVSFVDADGYRLEYVGRGTDDSDESHSRNWDVIDDADAARELPGKIKGSKPT
jgi:hypothetical protein